jgi:hypothetical protein
MNALNHLRKAKVYISTQKAATIIGKGADWVRKNRHLFGSEEQQDYRHEGKNLKWELSAVLQVAANYKDEFKPLKYQGANASLYDAAPSRAVSS